MIQIVVVIAESGRHLKAAIERGRNGNIEATAFDAGYGSWRSGVSRTSARCTWSSPFAPRRHGGPSLRTDDAEMRVQLLREQEHRHADSTLGDEFSEDAIARTIGERSSRTYLRETVRLKPDTTEDTDGPPAEAGHRRRHTPVHSRS